MMGDIPCLPVMGGSIGFLAPIVMGNAAPVDAAPARLVPDDDAIDMFLD